MLLQDNLRTRHFLKDLLVLEKYVNTYLMNDRRSGIVDNEDKRQKLTMSRQQAIKTICFSIFLFLTTNALPIGVARSTEFEIEEIITAIKNEIKTANISELGSPNFIIETVDVSLNVFSTETEKGALAVKILGYGDEVRNETLVSKSHHNLGFSFQPSGAFGFSQEISLGLVEPIKKVKTSLRRAYNSPPGFQMEGFTFKLEFAIEKSMDGGIRFKVIALDDLKALNVTTHHVTIHMRIQS